MNAFSDCAEPSLISLYTGAGGLDLGLEQAGFDVKVCVERDHERCFTLALNRPKWKVLERDIGDIGTEEVLKACGLSFGETDLLSGGPSCQPFSKSAFWVKDRVNNIASDPRTKLIEQFARVVKEARPKAFLMENVHGFVYKTSKPVFDRFIQIVKSAGYECSWKVLDAADYGIPQRRKRVFIVGSRDEVPFIFPPAKVSPNDYVTAGDALDNLDNEVIHEDERVRGKWQHLLPLIPPGENYLYLTEQKGYPNPIFKWRSRYWSFLLKLSPDKPSWTIQARPGPYTGPFHWRNRRLRILEIKRLQGFPDEWQFYGERRSIWAQIGDATPPPLAKALGEAIMEQIIQY